MAVFGPHHLANPTVLTDIPQCPVLLELDSPITFEEVDTNINKLKMAEALESMVFHQKLM
jgi:hypothetical protein